MLHVRLMLIATTFALLAGCSSIPERVAVTSPVSARIGNCCAELADSLARARQYREAAAQYAHTLRLQPESLSIAKRALGSFWRAARYDDAYSWGRRVIAADPGSLSALFDMGVTCGFLIAVECADSAFRRTVEINPIYVYGHGELGFLAQARGDLAAAVRHMEAAYVAAPSNDFAVSGLAQMLIPFGAADRARDLLEASLAQNRRAPAYGGRSMLTLYGWTQLVLGDTAGAKASFDEVLQWLRVRENANETSYQLHRERAAIYAVQGEKKAAIEAMNVAYNQGWRLYASWSLPDLMFAPVVNEPEVVKMIERMRADVREMRKRVGLSPQ
ncbi:MAG: hypothetical protein WED32_03215 [Patescibacteria group bacterium]